MRLEHSCLPDYLHLFQAGSHIAAAVSERISSSFLYLWSLGL